MRVGYRKRRTTENETICLPLSEPERNNFQRLGHQPWLENIMVYQYLLNEQNTSGRDASGATSLSFNKAMTLGGLAAGATSNAVRVLIDNPNALPFTLAGKVLAGPADTAPVMNALGQLQVQMGNATLKSPALLNLPNVAEYTAGTEMNLWGLNATTGEFEIIGQGWVSDDGRTVKTANGGIVGSGLYFFAPVPKETLADSDNPLISSESNFYRNDGETINSEANFADGSVTDVQNLISYQSLGVTRQFQLRYNSQWADPTEFFQATYDNFKPGQNYQWLTQRIVLRHGNFVQEVPSATQDLLGGIFGQEGLVGGEHFYNLGNKSGRISSGALPVDFSNQSSGVYQVEQTVALKKLKNGRYFGSGTTVEALVPFYRKKL